MKPADPSRRSWIVHTSSLFPIRMPRRILVSLWTHPSVMFVAMFLLIAGCSGGDGLDRKGISGKVTVDGKAVPDGAINFTPLGGSNIAGGAMITAGTYSIDQVEGLPPGKYLVTLTGNDGSAPLASATTMPGDVEFVPPKSVIPPDWNNEKHEVEVGTGPGPYSFDFDIKTKN